MNKWILETTTSEDVVKDALRFKDKVWNWFTDADMWANILFASLRILIIFLLTRVIIKIVSNIIDRSLDRKTGGRILSNTRRFTTVGELMKNVVTVICNFVMIMIVLSEFHFDLAPLLAGAGVLGLAVGFGAQSLVKDVITGFFIILEDQFAVGDVIQTGTYKGTVELIGLRTTRLLSATGEVFIIPNGLITNVTNYSLANALAVVDVPVKMERSLEATLGLIGEALKGIEERNSNVLAYPNVLGIQSMSTSEYVIRIAASCAPNARDAAERQIQNDIKQALEKQNMLEQTQAEEEARKKAEEEEAKAEINLLKTDNALEATESPNTRSRRQIAATQQEGEEGEE
jgi:small conductance mechanosensitive channel